METLKSHKILSVKGINFSYGEKKALSKINFSLNEGEVLGIIGESGSGKTTLLKVLAAKLPPDEGEVHFKGENIYNVHNQLLGGHENIKIVDQDFDLMPYITVDENILRNSLSLSVSSRKKLLANLKSNLKLRSVGKNKAKHTSGGQKQRVALATAVAAKPDILILDEPFANLDYALKVDVIRLLRNEWRAKAMIIVAHEPSDLLSLCDRVLVLNKGKVIQKGSSREVYQTPKNIYTARLLGQVNELKPEVCHGLGLAKNQNWVRPHELTLSDTGLPGKVENIHFCGSHTEVEVRLNEYLQVLAINLPGAASVRKDQEVFVKLKVE